MKPSQLRPHQSTLMIAGLISLLVWTIPHFGFVLLPLQYLNTHLHEFCHAFTASITGGSVKDIHVFGSGGGVTLASGTAYLINPAGYLGATILGGLMIWMSRTEKGAAIAVRGVACILLLSFIIWVRGDVVGVFAGLVWMGILFGIPFVVKGRNLIFVGQFLGMQQCLASVQSLYILFRISAYGEQHSDAGNMASATGIPAIVWATLWGAIGLGVMYVTLRASWSNRPAA